MRLGRWGSDEPETSERMLRVLERYPSTRFKLDPTNTWSDELIEELAASGAVDSLDLKGQYKGTPVDVETDPELYRKLIEAFPDAWLEDPDITDETRPILEPVRDRITWDAPIHSVDDVLALEWEPRMVNIKPSRVGSLRELGRAYDFCAERGIGAYGGGQTELGVGRDHIQYLAALFHPDTPNDVAPRGFNAPQLRGACRRARSTCAPAPTGLPLRVIEAYPLLPNGQTALDIAHRVAAFLGEARKSLDLALYDIRLPGEPGDVVAGALRDASARGVSVRLAYNADHRRAGLPGAAAHEARADRVAAVPDGRHPRHPGPDAPQVRGARRRVGLDRLDELDGRLLDAPGERDRHRADSPELAAEFAQNFEELWRERDVDASRPRGPAHARRRRATGAGLVHARATARSCRTGSRKAIGRARERVRIASPVITAGPVIGDAGGGRRRGRVDLRGVVDRTQLEQVFHQWRDNGHSAWKIPILASVLAHADFSGKPSTTYGTDTPHDFMHAKVTVADDTVFVGSFNLSRSGERNAENVLEIAGRRARRPAGRLHRRDPRALRADARA